MAGEFADTGDHRNQNNSLCAALASVRRAGDRHDSAGVLGPDAVLDDSGTGEEAARIPTLL